MARINTGLLVFEAMEVAGRVGYVSSDPNVIRSARQLVADSRQTARSAADLGQATAEAWRRSGPAVRAFRRVVLI